MRKIIIMGAGGRDFHDFNVVYRDDPGTGEGSLVGKRVLVVEDGPTIVHRILVNDGA